jgi:replicative DNA helicase
MSADEFLAPVQDLRAERALLGTIIVSAGRVLDEIDFDVVDYFNSQHEQLHTLLLEMRDNRHRINETTVAGRLDAGAVKGFKGTSVFDILGEVPIVAHAAAYARQISECAIRRRLTTAGVRTQQLARADGDIEEICEKARAEVDNASRSAFTSDLATAADAFDAFVDEISTRQNHIPTPWDDLNHLIGGWRPGNLIIIGARPGIGKSALGLQAATGIARTGLHVLISSMEMSKSEVISRAIAQTGRISATRLARPDDLTPHDWDVIAKLRGEFNDLPIHISDRGSRLVDIRRDARTLARKGKLGAIVVDYLQLIQSTGRGNTQTRAEEVGEMSRYLKRLAVDLDVPVIAMAQLNRVSESRPDKTPRLSDLKESGSIEQDANLVILAHRDIEADDDTKLLLSVAKNRSGPTGAVHLEWQGSYVRARAKEWTPHSAAGKAVA